MAASALSPVLSPLIRLNCKSKGFYTLTVLNQRVAYSIGLPTSNGAERQGLLERGNRGLRKPRRAASAGLFLYSL
ncbi:hypothetical protein PDJAM_G00255070 [Pangasius djambal]|uniref:Uncharacterized protein n=1 Tax=Pangasius djambal TaxID=1691987 RepID=A0ACC5YK59_9TELE|nr:hypothetical protein [Pangasius djambal]